MVIILLNTWWCHQMETFSTLLALCVGNSPITGEFPSQRPVTWSFDVFFALRLNKQLSKETWGWWFEMPSYPLWCHCNDTRHCNNDSSMFTGMYSDHTCVVMQTVLQAAGILSALMEFLGISDNFSVISSRVYFHYLTTIFNCRTNNTKLTYHPVLILQWNHMSIKTSQITGNSVVHSTACWDQLHTMHQNSTLLTLCDEKPLVTSGDQWILLTKGQQSEKNFHAMISSSFCEFQSILMIYPMKHAHSLDVFCIVMDISYR